MEIRYLELEEAKEKLAQRLSDEKTVEQIEGFIKGYLGEDYVLESRGKLILPRQIATSRIETAIGALNAQNYGLPFQMATFVEDYFTTASKEKIGYINIPVFEGIKTRIVQKDLRGQLNQRGLTLNQIIVDSNGTTLPEFHRSILDNVFKDSKYEIRDYSKEFKKLGNAREYYGLLLALFGGLNILYDDFHSGQSGEDNLRRLRNNCVIPGIENLVSETNLSPLIVKPTYYENDFKYILDEKTLNRIQESYKNGN